jgi:hypothetical protein
MKPIGCEMLSSSHKSATKVPILQRFNGTSAFHPLFEHVIALFFSDPFLITGFSTSFLLHFPFEPNSNFDPQISLVIRQLHVSS